MFIKRLVSGVILVILAILIVPGGGLPLFAASFLISLCGQFELYRVLKIEKAGVGMAGYLTTVCYYGLIWRGEHRFVTLMVIAALMCMMGLYVVTYPKYSFVQVSAAFIGIFYVAVMLSYLYQVRCMPDGRYMVWLIFLSSWGCDTCAYCVGRLFGRHKMTPVLSPKKTVEGAVGGSLGAACLGALYAAAFGGRMTEFAAPVITCTAACLVASFISQLGDLAASAVKRDHGIKDYGDLIPGHGGILDRFDSVLFTAPAIFFAVTFFGWLF